MKILIAAAAMLAALTSYPATAPEAAAPIVYAVGATVAEIDTAWNKRPPPPARRECPAGFSRAL